MKSISNLITAKLYARTRELDQLNRVIRATVPENCKHHISVAGIRENQLILVTDSPVWASRLRLYTQNMISMLAEHAGIDVNSVRIKLIQPKIEPEAPAPKHRHLNKSNADMIKQTADSIDDPELRQALYHLAENQKENIQD